MHRHLLNCWKDAALRTPSIQPDTALSITDSSTPARPHCSHGPRSPASSGCRCPDQTSTPVSLALANCSYRPARSAEPYYHLDARRLEQTHLAQTMDASGTVLRECKFYGCLVPRLYNTVRPHSSLGYRPPASEARLTLTNKGRGEMETAPRFPLPHTPDDGYQATSITALH